jgi:hypothetical protein
MLDTHGAMRVGDFVCERIEETKEGGRTRKIWLGWAPAHVAHFRST